GVPAFVQHAGDLEPGVVDAETGRPDHSADAHGDEVELEDRVADTLRIRAKDVSLGLRWQVESIAFDVLVGLAQQRQVVLVSPRDVPLQIFSDLQLSVGIGIRPTEQGDARFRKVSKIHGVAALGTADSDRDMLGSGRSSGHVPLAQHPEAPAKVTVAVGARRTVVWTDGEMDRSPRALDLRSDLRPRGPSSDDEHTALVELLGVLIGVRVNLRQSRL